MESRTRRTRVAAKRWSFRKPMVVPRASTRHAPLPPSEPARANRDVRVPWTPRGAVRATLLEHAPHVVAVGAGIANDGRIDGRPIRVAGDAALVADPADVGRRVGEDHGVRLVLPHEIPDSWP